MKKWIYLCLIGLSSSVLAQDQALTIQPSIPNNFELAFPNDRNVYPQDSQFKINDYALLANEEGERWVLTTITNTSSGSRTLTNKHVMGLFANGTRRQPVEFSKNFEGSETISIMIYFGNNKFPILNIYTSHKP